MECPLGLVYDDSDSLCVEPSQLGTCPPQTTTPSEELSTEPPVDGSVTEQPTVDGSGIPLESCEGLADGIFERLTCSSYYLTCSGGIARVMACPANLVFDRTLKVCNYPRDVAECEGVCKEDGFFNYGNCSDQFYACSNGEEFTEDSDLIEVREGLFRTGDSNDVPSQIGVR
ncbi:chitin binding Peritrophin-A domain protein [Oesophagostomum dentatum]|uniref:Chitin binding Peritrophin-A domain protein n=1 Tax=Oesophagostomum dentatum TaxID=61180 RepID=A0A0B1S1Y0_OESDE|nr:chitin binding Peritrophin-A domain protein [Oesophagostomum dentatum]